MKRCLLTILILASLPLWATSGKITTSGSDCSVSTRCLVVSLPEDKGGATLTLSGTWTGTIQFEATGDGGTTWSSLNVFPLNSTTAVTSTTSNGTWQVNTAGFTGIRMRASATVTGTALATITSSAASARSNGGGGGGSGTVTSIATTSPITGGTITTTGTIACPTCAITPTVPAIASFAWVNQGSSTTTQTVASGPIILTIPDDNTSLNWRGMFVDQPATPYKVIVQMRGLTTLLHNTQTNGIYFYDGTKLMGIEFLFQTSQLNLRVEKITNVTTDSSTAASLTGSASTTFGMADFYSPAWLQIRNSGTTIYFDYSFDGANFTNLFNEAVGTFITPTKVGFAGICVTSATDPNTIVEILSWATAANATL